MNRNALCGFEEEDFDGVVSVFGDADFGEIIVNELYAKRVIDEDLLASASLIGFTASKEESDGLQSPRIGSGGSHRKAFEVTPREERLLGDASCRDGDREGQLGDGEDGLWSLSIVGAKVFPWTKTSPEPYRESCEEEAVPTGGVFPGGRGFENRIDPFEVFKSERDTEGLPLCLRLRGGGREGACVSLEDFFDDEGGGEGVVGFALKGPRCDGLFDSREIGGDRAGSRVRLCEGGQPKGDVVDCRPSVCCGLMGVAEFYESLNSVVVSPMGGGRQGGVTKAFHTGPKCSDGRSTMGVCVRR